MFWGMTPPECSCILGRYRGDAACSYLTNVRVTAGNDRRVGIEPYLVQSMISHLESQCHTLMASYERWRQAKGSKLSPGVALAKFVTILADVLQKFLTIHPYMDGNGHTARLLVFTMMARAGYLPTNWEIDAKQPYAQALSDHRSGKPGALEKFLLNAIVGSS